MDYTTLINYASALLAIMAALVFATTIIVELVKNLFPNVPTNFVAVAVSVIFTMIAVCILCAFLEIPIMWHYVASAFILGLFVGYAAMFGFDKFKAAFEKLKLLKT